jgi:hypothetical protein
MKDECESQSRGENSDGIRRPTRGERARLLRRSILFFAFGSSRLFGMRHENEDG